MRESERTNEDAPDAQGYGVRRAGRAHTRRGRRRKHAIGPRERGQPMNDEAAAASERKSANHEAKTREEAAKKPHAPGTETHSENSAERYVLCASLLSSARALLSVSSASLLSPSFLFFASRCCSSLLLRCIRTLQPLPLPSRCTPLLGLPPRCACACAGVPAREVRQSVVLSPIIRQGLISTPRV